MVIDGIKHKTIYTCDHIYVEGKCIKCAEKEPLMLESKEPVVTKRKKKGE